MKSKPPLMKPQMPLMQRRGVAVPGLQAKRRLKINKNIPLIKQDSFDIHEMKDQIDQIMKAHGILSPEQRKK